MKSYFLVFYTLRRPILNNLLEKVISAMVGFANRQSFYAAFYKNIGETPNGYRKRHLEDKK